MSPLFRVHVYLKTMFHIVLGIRERMHSIVSRVRDSMGGNIPNRDLVMTASTYGLYMTPAAVIIIDDSYSYE